MKWQVISNHALNLHCWGDECVVYNSLSGDTHLLGSAAVNILTKLQQAPADAAVLSDALRRDWQLDPAEELGPQVQEILAELHALALIEEVT